MRHILITLALTLAACSPAPAPSAPAAQPPAAPPSAANADAHTVQQTPIAGQWAAHADEGTFAARFTGADGGELLSIVCTAPTGNITITLHHSNATSLRLISATRTLQLAAQNGVTRSAGYAPERDALIATLGTPGDHLAIEAGGATTVFPWDDAIAATLHACR